MSGVEDPLTLPRAVGQRALPTVLPPTLGPSWRERILTHKWRLYLPVCLQAHLGHLFGNIPFEAAPLWEGLQASWTPGQSCQVCLLVAFIMGSPLQPHTWHFIKWQSGLHLSDDFLSQFSSSTGEAKMDLLPIFCKEKFSSKGLSEIWTKIQSFSHCDIQKLETNYTSTSKIQSKFLKPLKLVFK